MSPTDPVYIVATLIAAVGGLLLLVIRAKVPAFFALILVSLVAGLMLGLSPVAVIDSVQNGMAGVLGFIAVVVGLGAILGAILEHSGGVQSLSDRLATGSVKNVPIKMSFLGLLVAIPVFFDVALVILMPMIRRLAQTIQRNALYVAAPLLAGLAAAHAFVPPTPGPIAVAALLNADLGLVILAGIVAAVPAILVGGVWFARRQYNTPLTDAAAPIPEEPSVSARSGINFYAALAALAFPIILVASGTVVKMTMGDAAPAFILFMSHPFVALLLTVGLYYTFAATTLNMSATALNTASMKSLEPAGAVVLVTGAGGAFKQVVYVK
ncbi:MAG: gluconate transporter [Pseudomonadota bacterium]